MCRREMRSTTKEEESNNKSSTEVGERRALHWQVLRVALLWVRKGGALRQRLMVDFRLLLDYLKTLQLSLRHAHHHHHQKHQQLLLPYRRYEREMSFDDETPIFIFKIKKIMTTIMHKPRFSCINLLSPPSTYIGGGSGDDHHNHKVSLSYSFNNTQTEGGEEEEEEEEEEEDNDYDDDEERRAAAAATAGGGDQTGGGGIDDMAEEFIRKFHQQMKLQRQISLLRYNDMLQRSIS